MLGPYRIRHLQVPDMPNARRLYGAFSYMFNVQEKC